MWHNIAFVAESRKVDAQALEAFALANQDKYGIATDEGKPEVNTWHVDMLVADYKAQRVCTCNRGPHMAYCDLFAPIFN